MLQLQPTQSRYLGGLRVRYVNEVNTALIKIHHLQRPAKNLQQKRVFMDTKNYLLEVIKIQKLQHYRPSCWPAALPPLPSSLSPFSFLFIVSFCVTYSLSYLIFLPLTVLFSLYYPPPPLPPIEPFSVSTVSYLSSYSYTSTSTSFLFYLASSSSYIILLNFLIMALLLLLILTPYYEFSLSISPFLVQNISLPGFGSVSLALLANFVLNLTLSRIHFTLSSIHISPLPGSPFSSLFPYS